MKSICRLTTILLLTTILGIPTVAADEPDTGAVVETEEAASVEAPEPLGTDELAELQARAEEPGDEVAGGALSTQQLTYIVIALAAAVIAILAS